MLLSDFVYRIFALAPKYRHSPEGEAIIDELAGRPIDTDVATALIEPMIVMSARQPEGETVQRILQGKLTAWAPDALARIARNRHMHHADGQTTINRNTADALIVDFANFACAPAELCMNSHDLHRS